MEDGNLQELNQSIDNDKVTKWVDKGPSTTPVQMGLGAE